MRGPLSLLAAVTLGNPTLGQAIDLDAEAVAKLESGKVIVERLDPEGGSGVAVRAWAVVQAKPARVWPVVRDCGEFSQFMPRTKESRQFDRQDNTRVCRVTMEIPFPFEDISSDVRSVEQVLPEGGFRRSFSLLQGDFERTEGSWTVMPWDEDGERTLLVYESDSELKSVLPDFILGAAQVRTLPDVIQAVRGRVKEVGEEKELEQEMDVASPPP